MPSKDPRKNIAIRPDTWEDALKLTGAEGAQAVIDKLVSLARKGLRDRESLPSEAGTQSVDGDKVPEPSSGFSQKGDDQVPALPEKIVNIVKPDLRPALTYRPLHPLQEELLKQRIETEKARRISATSRAMEDVRKCPYCGILLVGKIDGHPHIVDHNRKSVEAFKKGDDRSSARSYCFTHHAMEPVDSVCFLKLTREQLIASLRE